LVTPPRLCPGDRLGPYEVVGALGAGGMGEVYRARDTRLGRDVALKVLPQSLAADSGRLARFRREAQTLAALNQPNIAAIYGLEDTPGTPCLVLELVEGETLAARIARAPLPPEEAMRCAVQIAAAIEAAHERGIVHRDLKPGNVMLARGDLVKVVDFGLAKSDPIPAPASGPDMATATVEAGGSMAGLLVGTLAYMSPEQARGQPVDRRTDIWSFGCVLYECLSGRPPFAGQTASDVIAGIHPGAGTGLGPDTAAAARAAAPLPAQGRRGPAPGHARRPARADRDRFARRARRERLGARDRRAAVREPQRPRG
jgi:serine/threonine protein kinase